MREFAVLICAHILGDFLFQTNWIAQNKHTGKGWGAHVILHGMLVYVICMQWRMWALALIIAALHGVVDAFKSEAKDTPITFVVDQAAHIGILGVIAIVLQRQGVVLTPDPYYSIIVWAAGGVAVTRGAGIAVSKVAKHLVEENQLEVNGLRHGGEYIGNLERILIFLLIIIGQPGAIGFLVAAKSILRFEEAKQQEIAEYVLIGTLLSFTLAVTITYLARNAAAL